MGLDLLPDLVPIGAEEVDRDVQVPGFVHLDEAIERDPAQYLRVGVMESAGAPLPNALVRLAPSLAHCTAQAIEHPARVSVEASTAIRELCCGVEDFAVYVELKLALGVVADPHRARPRVPFQMR